MYPVLLTIDTWKLYANLTFFVLGCAVGVILGMREAPKMTGMPKASALAGTGIFISGIALAYWAGKLNGGLFILLQQGGGWNALLQGGFVSFGAILGALLYGFCLAKIARVPPGGVMDLIALIFPLMESIYRIGCVLTGCCFGRETNGFGAFYLPEIHGVWAYRYPTQMLLLVFNLLLFIGLWRMRARLKEPGSLTMVFLLVYCAGRFLIDGLRGDMPMVWGLGYQQVASLVIFALTAVFYVRNRNIQRLHS